MLSGKLVEDIPYLRSGEVDVLGRLGGTYRLTWMYRAVLGVSCSGTESSGLSCGTDGFNTDERMTVWWQRMSMPRAYWITHPVVNDSVAPLTVCLITGPCGWQGYWAKLCIDGVLRTKSWKYCMKNKVFMLQHSGGMQRRWHAWTLHHAIDHLLTYENPEKPWVVEIIYIFHALVLWKMCTGVSQGTKWEIWSVREGKRMSGGKVEEEIRGKINVTWTRELY